MANSDIKVAALWAFSGVAIAIAAFSTNYWVLGGSLPGYKLMVYPGIVATRLFSEEIDFASKLSVMLAGQYLGFFVFILVGRKLAKRVKGHIGP